MSLPRTSALICGTCFKASMDALTKKDMKPSLVPYFCAKISPNSLRRAMTADMSASLKVVRSAALCCASNRRRAAVRRSRVMGTTSSSRELCGGFRVPPGRGDGSKKCAAALAGSAGAVSQPERIVWCAGALRLPGLFTLAAGLRLGGFGGRSRRRLWLPWPEVPFLPPRCAR